MQRYNSFSESLFTLYYFMFKIRDFTKFKHKITIFKQKSAQTGEFYRQKLVSSKNKTYICTEFKHNQDEPIHPIKPCHCGGCHHFSFCRQAHLYAKQAPQGETSHGLCVHQYHPRIAYSPHRPFCFR